MPLPFCQALERVAEAASDHEFLHKARIDDRASANDPIDAFEEVIHVGDAVFEEVARPRACSQKVHRLLDLDMSRQDEHRRLRKLLPDDPCRIEPFGRVGWRHAYVNDDQMREMLAYELDDFVGVACLSDHVVVRLREKHSKSVAQQHVVVGHGDTSGLPPGSFARSRGSHDVCIRAGLATLALAPMRWRSARPILAEMPLRFLLVDDNPAFLEIARTVLEQEGATVIGVAQSLVDASREARALTPDVTLVDIDMPAMNGFEVVRELSETGEAGQLILVSAHAPEEFAEMVESSPAICFISKAELSVEAIERCLAQARSEREG